MFESKSDTVLRLSPNYGVLQLIYATGVVCLLVGAPQFTVRIRDPNAEIEHDASNAYTVECYAFAARAVGYHGDTMCVSYKFGGACWEVFQSMQLQECSEDPGVIFPAVAETLQSFGYLNDWFTVTIVVLCVLGLVMIGAAYIYPARRSTLLFLTAVGHGIALLLATALMATSAMAVSAVTYDTDSNKGQSVDIGAGMLVVVSFPYIALFIDAIPRALSPPTSKSE